MINLTSNFFKVAIRTQLPLRSLPPQVDTEIILQLPAKIISKEKVKYGI